MWHNSHGSYHCLEPRRAPRTHLSSVHGASVLTDALSTSWPASFWSLKHYLNVRRMKSLRGKLKERSDVFCLPFTLCECGLAEKEGITKPYFHAKKCHETFPLCLSAWGHDNEVLGRKNRICKIDFCWRWFFSCTSTVYHQGTLF